MRALMAVIIAVSVFSNDLLTFFLLLFPLFVGNHFGYLFKRIGARFNLAVINVQAILAIF